MFSLTGDFGSIQFEQQRNIGRFIDIPVGTSIKLFNKLAIKYAAFEADALGLFTVGSIGRNQKVNFMSFNSPKHVLQARNNGCTWNPKGRVTNNLESTILSPIEYNGEECPDEFWGDCLETIFGTGNDIRDFESTPEAKQVFMYMLDRVYLGLGNSFHELAMWGNHPLITIADINDYVNPNVSALEWEDYMSQQSSATGIMTLIETLKTQGRDNYNLPIYPNEVSGALFIGDAFGLIDRTLNSATGVMSQVVAQAAFSGTPPIIQVSAGIFNRMIEQLVNKFTTIPDIYNFVVQGRSGALTPLPNVIKYKGYLVYNNPSFKLFDEITGIINHRIIVSPAGTFGIVSDVLSLQQFEGMGMRILQRLDAPFQGKVYMNTNFRVGTAILDSTLIFNGSLSLYPAP